MADTTFVDGTVVEADWLNDVNDNVYGPTAAAGTLRAQLLDTAIGNGGSRVGLVDTAGNFPSLTGANKTVENALATVAARAYGANVVLYGADNTGVADSSTAFGLAAATGKTVYVPDGTYSVNWTITQHLICIGDAQSILSPRNTAIAAVVFQAPAPNWTYQSLFQNIRFLGTSRVGVGFTFGRTVPSDYVAGDEVFNGVTFRNCYFRDLNKGLQRPFGNIGVELYSCGFTDNKYGIYSLDNKFGAAMHAGNLYVFGGQIDNCDVGIYSHDVTTHMYGVQIVGTIFEINKINVYSYQITAITSPWLFDGVGNEQSGSNLGGSTSIDQWSGTTLSTTSFTNRCWIFDGSSSDYIFDQGGIIGDIYLKATNSRVVVNSAKTDANTANSGGPCTVDNADSEVVFRDPIFSQGVPKGSRVFHEGAFRPSIVDLAASNSTRWGQFRHRYIKAASYGGTGSRLNMTSAETTVGLALLGVVTADGILYGNCNQYTVAGGATDYAYLPTINVTGVVGNYAVCTLAVKWVSGLTPRFFVGDLGTSQIGGQMSPPETGVWYTLGCIGKVETTAGIRVQFERQASASVFNLQSVQVRLFATRGEAQAFLDSGVYVES